MAQRVLFIRLSTFYSEPRERGCGDFWQSYMGTLCV